MVNSFDIVSQIRSYLDGRIDLATFRQWIVRSQIEMENQEGQAEKDQDSARLLADVEVRYAELSKQMVSEEQWKRRLAALTAPRPQSAESCFLSYFYSPTSGFQLLGASATFEAPQASNFNLAPNYQPALDPECAAA